MMERVHNMCADTLRSPDSLTNKQTNKKEGMGAGEGEVGWGGGGVGGGA